MQETTLTIEQRAVEPFFKNGFVLVCSAGSQAAYIDPGDEAGELISWVENQNLTLSSILLTHGHLDHISGVATVKGRWDVPVYLHREDEFLYNALKEQGEWFGFNYPSPPPVDHYLEPDKDVQVGDLSIRIHHTPGHSPGSVTLEIKQHLFCGDLIFAGSIGRTDLPGGSHEVLTKTVREKIFSLPEEMILHPGHGSKTTVGQEMRTNPFFTELAS